MNVIKARNYCRNPDRDPAGPWCVIGETTNAGAVQFEHCLAPGYTKGSARTQLGHIAVEMQLWVYPAVFLTGTVLNMLSICTFAQPTLINKPLSLRFIVLAVSDMSNLYLGALEQFLERILAMPLSSANNLSCQIFAFVMYNIVPSSGWILTVTAAERVAVMANPFGFSNVCSKNMIISIIFGLIFSISNIFSIPSAMYIVSNYDIIQNDDDIRAPIIESRCVLDSPNESVYIKVTNLVMDIFVLPSCFILVGNILLITLLHRTYKKRRELGCSNSGLSDSNQVHCNFYRCCFTCYMFYLS